ncbi:proline--tRNA ligase [Pseudoflavitalea sp. X16]|uniref:proline--tRNA ligase n=1 Tax=Paraflavitalea devenefica TaxID=2716334 RepID=UPI0014205CD7|nr:proline--tRNA ligase [Paraflavitalea devenefica]NII27067.1 proline--tRNA ligase [Paraflavitalea devenefica]
MRFSKILYKTSKGDSKEVEIRSASLLVRAGYIRQLSSGIFSYLHFGQRSLKKIEGILREEMNAIGGDEICMPVVHPADIWKKTNRWYQIDQSLVRFKDRADRDMVLAMTHEEVVAELCVSEIDSYKQLPKLVYQIFTKFRDEARSRGGLIRVREFTMKDSYSLDRDEAGMVKQYKEHYNAYFKIFARAGLPAVAINSDTGMMGGRMAHEYMYVTPIGEDTVFISDDNKYKANKEIATFKKIYSSKAEAPLEKVHTPGVKTIEDLANFMQMSKEDLCKAVFYTAKIDDKDKVVLLLVRGDTEVNTVKLEKIIKTDKYAPSTAEEILRIGAVPGYASPVGIDRTACLVIADDLVANAKSMVAGANEVDYHMKNVAYGRDFTADVVADVVSAFDGALSPHENSTGSRLRSVRGIEIGNIFQLGTRYTTAMGAVFNDEDGVQKPVIMGSYGIGVGRLLACLAEEYMDDKGLSLPVSVAPYHVALVALADKPELAELADKTYEQLKADGIEVFYDDREMKMASAGVKFADADLIGIPIRITISKRSVQNGGAEIKLRKEEKGEIVPLDQLSAKVKEIVQGLFAQLKAGVDAAEKWVD